jgi:hypothetical protein
VAAAELFYSYFQQVATKLISMTMVSFLGIMTSSSSNLQMMNTHYYAENVLLSIQINNSFVKTELFIWQAGYVAKEHLPNQFNI